MFSIIDSFLLVTVPPGPVDSPVLSSRFLHIELLDSVRYNCGKVFNFKGKVSEESMFKFKISENCQILKYCPNCKGLIAALEWDTNTWISIYMCSPVGILLSPARWRDLVNVICIPTGECDDLITDREIVTSWQDRGLSVPCSGLIIQTSSALHPHCILRWWCPTQRGSHILLTLQLVHSLVVLPITVPRLQRHLQCPIKLPFQWWNCSLCLKWLRRFKIVTLIYISPKHQL